MAYLPFRFQPRLWGLVLFASVCLPGQFAHAQQSLEEQRKLFVSARSALSSGKITAYRDIKNQLTDYPLYPYLEYDYLQPRLSSAKDQDIIDFLNRYDDLPVADDLRQAWLKLLAQRGKWQVFLDNYTDQQDTSLQCYQQIARIKTNNTAGLLEDTRSLWLSGKSQPDVCNPAFDVLYKSDLMTPALVWERVRLAMRDNQPNLASWLGQKLDSDDQRWVARWVATWHNPAKLTSNPKYEDTPIAREILVDGIKKLARADLDTAISRWETLKSSYAFDQEQVPDIVRTLARMAVILKHPKSTELLDAIDNSSVDEELFHWRLRDALAKQNWQTLIKWTDGEPTEEAIRLRWLYWRARALEQTGEVQPAREIYQVLANKRDYYGFMAADRISAPYTLTHLPLPEDPETWHAISDLGGVKRAYEFYMLGNAYPARREWGHVLKGMTHYQMQIAASLAANWGWHDRTILTLGQAKAYDDLILRFPLVFEDQLKKYAGLRKLDLSWLYALTRAESAFMVDARSSSGALGLMQVMPVTGQETAKSIGFGGFKRNHLLEADSNITIGTAYLKQMHDRFGSKLLATAAYNAGPNAVAAWLPDAGCMEPDIWVETIPFSETRRYVTNIMYFSTVYDWRLNNDVARLNEKMHTIYPRRSNSIADAGCPATTVSHL
jgi:soluble lytic murein transglycosylase